MHLTVHTASRPLRLEAPTGANLADVLTRAGLNLDLACGGHGTCKRCGVFLRSGNFHRGTETLVTGTGEATPCCRLSCGEGPGEIEVPATALMTSEGRILEDYQLPAYTLAPTVQVARGRTETGHTWITRAKLAGGWLELFQTGDKPLAPLGVAVDIGTTTVAAILLNLATGEVLERASMYNQQLRRADDVASRISACRSVADVREMQVLVVEETINVLIVELCAAAVIPPERILRIALAGNTTMMHLMAGLSPATLGILPFRPLATSFPPRPAVELGLKTHPSALADLLPSASAYIGADIVNDLLVSTLANSPSPALLVDIGTNGEIVLAHEGRLHACATAAGPAFEGAGLEHGCRASAGAIDHISISNDLEFRISVIHGGEATGICGSAVVDFLACGRRSGLLNEFGRYDLDKLRSCGRYLGVRTGHACLLSERAQGGRGPIYISEADIAQALKAKGAIQAGIQTLLEQCRCPEETLQRLVIAGGFGHFVELGHAAAIGLLPMRPDLVVEVIGNGSLAGAALALLDESAIPALEALATRPEIVELNRIASFEDRFIDALLLPGAVEQP